ncbi:MAG: glycosyltransferase family 1 protein [Deltaproteobacteria bacterium]|nr:glycosyltransferase family 1 protein [Deltaproteobacteria bacterium]
MIRVALMLPKLGRYGGAEQFGYRLAEYLAGPGAAEFDVTFICAKQDGPAPQGVRVVRVGRPLPGKLGKTLWFALAAEVARRQGRFDVSIGLGNTVFQDITRLSGGPTRLFWDYSIRAWPRGWPRRLKTMSRRLSPGKQLGCLIERLRMRHSQVLVANSEFVRDLSARAFPFLDADAIRVIHNQPDLRRFTPGDPAHKPDLRRRFDLPVDAELIVTAGTNFRLKGVHVLIQALPLLPTSFHLAVAGGRGSRDLTALAKNLDVAGRVHFLGRVDDMPSLYQAADIFALNTFYDACSNAVLEALACGLPTMSTTSNGSSVFLRPEAVLPDPADAAELARRVQLLIHGGATGRSDFSPPRGLEPYADLIRSLA